MGNEFFDNIGDHSKSAVLNEDDEKDSDSDLEIIYLHWKHVQKSFKH